MESETGPCELSAEFVFLCPGFQLDGLPVTSAAAAAAAAKSLQSCPTLLLLSWVLFSFRRSFRELGSCCAGPPPCGALLRLFQPG